MLSNMVSNKGKNYKSITVGEWINEWYYNYALNTTNEKYVKGKLSINEYHVSGYRIKYILNDTKFSNLILDEVSSSDIYLFVSNLKSSRKVVIKDNIINNKRNTNPYMHFNSEKYSYHLMCDYYNNTKKVFPSIMFSEDLYDRRINIIKEHYRDRYNDIELSFKTKKNIIDLLRMAFRCATRMEIIKSNPFDDFSYDETKELVNRKREALNEVERDIFLKVAESNRYFDCYLLMVYTGMRKAEALALTKKDIHIYDLDNGKEKDKDKANDSNNKLGIYIEINKQLMFTKSTRYQKTNITSITKSMHSIRKVPIANPEVISMLKDRINKLENDNDFIFGDIDEYMYLTYNRIYNEIKILFNICFLITGNEKYLTCHNHTLRHTFATIFLENYPNYLVQISAILGHSNTSFTAKQYVHLETEKIDISLLAERSR